jgi:hypothetical protein
MGAISLYGNLLDSSNGKGPTMNIICRMLLGLGLTGALAAALSYFWTAGPTLPQVPFSLDRTG